MCHLQMGIFSIMKHKSFTINMLTSNLHFIKIIFQVIPQLVLHKCPLAPRLMHRMIIFLNILNNITFIQFFFFAWACDYNQLLFLQLDSAQHEPPSFQSYQQKRNTSHECDLIRCLQRKHSSCPEVQKNVLKEEALVIMGEASKEEIEGLSSHVQIYKIKSNEASLEELLSWVRSARVFKKRALKSEC